jgi:hypothetical protein
MARFLLQHYPAGDSARPAAGLRRPTHHSNPASTRPRSHDASRVRAARRRNTPGGSLRTYCRGLQERLPAHVAVARSHGLTDIRLPAGRHTGHRVSHGGSVLAAVADDAAVGGARKCSTGRRRHLAGWSLRNETWETVAVADPRGRTRVEPRTAVAPLRRPAEQSRFRTGREVCVGHRSELECHSTIASSNRLSPLTSLRQLPVRRGTDHPSGPRGDV